jgi:hypothetical protein
MTSTVEISTITLAIIPAVAALVGALIGSAAALISTLIHECNERRRAQLRLAIEAAIHDHQHALEVAKLNPGQTDIAPFGDYIHFHITLLQLIETGRLNQETLMELQRQLEALYHQHRNQPLQT